MAVSVAQEAAFIGATAGVPMSSFSLTILLIVFSVLYLWVAWLMLAQWRSWSQGKIDFYDLLTRITRTILLTLVLGFLLQ